MVSGCHLQQQRSRTLVRRLRIANGLDRCDKKSVSLHNKYVSLDFIFIWYDSESRDDYSYKWTEILLHVIIKAAPVYISGIKYGV